MMISKFLKELKRRNVYKAAVAYLIVAWLVVQVASVVIPVFDGPPILMKVILFLLIIGFPINLILSWIYDVTPDGIVKTENTDTEPGASISKNSRLNRVILTSLTLVVVIFIINLFVIREMTVIDVGEKSIAVLAFSDMSPDQDQEYFSDGISEELLNLLAKVQDMRVISRTSSFSFKGKDATAVQIGNELNVSHILEGSIRKAGDQVRITAKLISTADGSQIWSETFNHVLDSIFEIQDEIAVQVTQQLKTTLLGIEPKSKTMDIEAFNLYLQAKHLAHLNTKSAYINAENLIKRSISIDSTHAMSWALLSDIYHTSTYNLSIYEYDEGIPLGLNAAKKAIELDPSSAKGYVGLASFQVLSWDFEQSTNNLKMALDLEPNNPIIVATAANMTYGDLNKSVELLKESIKLDPLLYLNYYNLGFSYLELGEYDKAEEAFNKFAIYYPNSQILHYMLSMVHMRKGNYEQALKEIDMETHEFFNIYGRNFIYYAMGRMEEADILFEEFIQKHRTSDPANIAALYAFRGSFEQAFVWLEVALEQKNPGLIEVLRFPDFDKIHKDPRWSELIGKIDLPKDHGYPLY